VVAGVGTRDRDAADADRLVGADVLVGEGRAGVVVDHVIAGQVVVGQVHRGGGGVVVDLVDAGSADGQGALADAGRGAGGGVLQAVVAGVGARDGDAADADRLAGAHVLVAEGSAGVAVGDAVS